MKDFTLQIYRELLKTLQDNGYKIITVRECFELHEKQSEQLCVLRHDVDRAPRNALNMAEIEMGMGICSTYYFRAKSRVFRPSIVREIADMGHEIGYHYEVVDRGRGGIRKAFSFFTNDLIKLREVAPPVITCAAHGNPLTKYNNRKFWDSFQPWQFGLIGEAENIPVDYFSDTGRWNRKFNLKDKAYDYGNYSIEDLMNEESAIYLNIHPERWNDGLRWYWQWLFDFGCNQVKRLVK